MKTIEKLQQIATIDKEGELDINCDKIDENDFSVVDSLYYKYRSVIGKYVIDVLSRRVGYIITQIKLCYGDRYFEKNDFRKNVIVCADIENIYTKSIHRIVIDAYKNSQDSIYPYIKTTNRMYEIVY